MMVCLYHRIGEGKWANSAAFMEEHLAWIAAHCRVVLPGEPLPLFSKNVCLTFDDATYDFYHYAFPLLKRLRLRCLLAVPVHYILEQSPLPAATRLSIPYNKAMTADLYRTHAPFCTWQELREMVQSGLVEIASHSMRHQHLLTPGLDLHHEIVDSKRLLEGKLHTPVRTFVYPLGKFDRKIHAEVKRHYEFAMRIGMAVNSSWQNWNNIVYRVLCDNLTALDEPFRMKRTLSSLWFYLLNTFRGR